MRGRKIYGQSQDVPCAFCGSKSTAKNGQDVPVCRHHKREEHNFKCACGEWLDVRESKYGTFFLCRNCGPISYSKALEINNLPLARVEDL